MKSLLKIHTLKSPSWTTHDVIELNLKFCEHPKLLRFLSVFQSCLFVQQHKLLKLGQMDETPFELIMKLMKLLHIWLHVLGFTCHLHEQNSAFSLLEPWEFSVKLCNMQITLFVFTYSTFTHIPWIISKQSSLYL